MAQPGTERSSRLVGLGLRLALLLAVLAMVQVGVARPLRIDQAEEYAVKAALLYKITSFVAWPNSAFESETSPIVVGVYGKDPFGKVLDSSFSKKLHGKRRFRIHRFKEPEQIEKVHLLFVPEAETEDLAEIRAHCAGKSVLLIGESKDFAIKGGIINFYIAKKRVRFEMNPKRAAKHKLKISSKLLALSRIVEDPKPSQGDAK